jgi:hypothetical protein
MKVTELRINNWVQFKHTETPVRVDLGDFVMAREYKDERLDDYEPIPLTEEWLEKFGFDEIEMSIPVAYKTKSGFRIKEDQRGYWMQYKYGTVIIKHVHQLQNLYFALTGEELTLIK